MTCNAKILGLVLIAVLVTSAMMAAEAGATTFPLQWTAGSYPAYVTGITIQHKPGDPEPFDHTLTTSGGAVITCKKVSSVGTITAATENLTVISKDEECTARIGAETLPVTVTTEDCDFVYHGGITEEPNSDNYKEGTVDHVCPAGKTAVIHVFQNAAKHTANESFCTLKIPGYTNKGENTLTNETGMPDTVIVRSTIPGIPLTREGSLLCGAANQTATFTGSTTFKAFQDLSNKTPSNGTLEQIIEGSQINLTVSKTP